MEHVCRPWTLPRDYMGATWEDWYSAGFGRSRDSDALEESNFQVASAELLKLTDHDLPESEYERIAPLGLDGQSVQIVRESHWAVGWVEWIAIHKSNTAAITRAAELCERANDYPILNEEHWSNLEYTRAMDYWDSLSLVSKVDFCRDCKVSIFAARRSHDLPDRLYESLIA